MRRRSFGSRRIEVLGTVGLALGLTAGGLAERLRAEPAPRAGGIQGTVPFLAETPIPGQVVAYRDNSADARKARVDEEGRFRFERLEPGDWNVAFAAEVGTAIVGGWRPEGEPVKVSVVEGEMARVEVPRPGWYCKLRGRVTRAGKPVPGAQVSITQSREGFSTEFRFPTREDGTFTAGGPAPGEARIRVAVSMGDLSAPVEVSRTFLFDVPKAGEQSVEVEFPSGEIAGRVRAARTGKPVVDAEVRAERRDAKWEDERLQATTDSEGKFRIPFLPDGSYRVTATVRRGGGLAPSTIEGVEVKGGERTAPTLDLPEGGRVRVEVVDEREKPVERAWVTLRPVTEEEFEPHPVAWWQTDARGLALLGELPAGRFYAAVESAEGPVGFSESTAVAAGKETSLRIRAVLGVAVSVRARGPSGESVTQSLVDFIDERSRRRRALSRWAGENRPEGGPARVSLPPGEYSLRVLAGGFGLATKRVFVKGPTPMEIVVDLEPPRSPR